MAEKMRLWSIVGAFAALALAAVAQADTNPCDADTKKFCADVKGGDLHVLKCMIDHADELSPECAERLKQAGVKPGKQSQPVREACKAEIAEHCKDVGGKPAKVKACLGEHQSELSDGCKTALKP